MGGKKKIYILIKKQKVNKIKYKIHKLYTTPLIETTRKLAPNSLIEDHWPVSKTKSNDPFTPDNKPRKVDDNELITVSESHAYIN